VWLTWEIQSENSSVARALTTTGGGLWHKKGQANTPTEKTITETTLERKLHEIKRIKRALSFPCSIGSRWLACLSKTNYQCTLDPCTTPFQHVQNMLKWTGTGRWHTRKLYVRPWGISAILSLSTGNANVTTLSSADCVYKKNITQPPRNLTRLLCRAPQSPPASQRPCSWNPMWRSPWKQQSQNRVLCFETW